MIENRKGETSSVYIRAVNIVLRGLMFKNLISMESLMISIGGAKKAVYSSHYLLI